MNSGPNYLQRLKPNYLRCGIGECSGEEVSILSAYDADYLCCSPRSWLYLNPHGEPGWMEKICQVLADGAAQVVCRTSVGNLLPVRGAWLRHGLSQRRLVVHRLGRFDRF